jgi:hypothetical protein
MMNRKLLAAGLCAPLLAIPLLGQAADHIDSPAAVAEPTADITDLYAWMDSDAENLNLITNVAPFAAEGMAFSDAVQYVFHVNSSAGYGQAQTETEILCQFTAPPEIECWVGDEYVAGDPSDEAGISSESGAIKVFAGLRDDPFFMEFIGFTETVGAVVAAAGGLDFDEEGCPDVPEETRAALVAQLMSGADGADASDTFAGQNVLSLVVQVDKSLVDDGGPVLGVWASTHAAQ